jgi:site-specific DNA-methyltransferase (adenine-specific)
MSMALPNREPNIEAKFAARRKAWAENPAILATSHKIYRGDARLMPDLGSKPTVHLIVTSPPYFNLIEYPNRPAGQQLGNFSDYDAFLLELHKVWQRCFDVLHPGGRLCVVVGDVCVSRKKAGRHYLLPLHADISRDCMSTGFDYLNPILWSKIANAATEVQGNGATFLGKPYEPNAVIKNNVEYILIFRRPGAYRNPTQEQRDLSVIEKENHKKWFRQVWEDIPGQSRWRGHPAPYPVELAYRLISMFSFVGDTVLDPFCGTGTTVEAAIKAHRSSVGYEVEPEYLKLVNARFSQSTLDAQVLCVESQVAKPDSDRPGKSAEIAAPA